MAPTVCGWKMGEENKIRDAADAIKGVAEAVPVYQDVFQPAAKEVGVALQTVAKTIHVALAPFSALVWGYDQIASFVNDSLTERLKRVPPERIVSPSPTVAGPVLEALRFAGHDPDLRELFANLLATSMDAETARAAHPAFAEMIRQMAPDEARVMRLLARANAYPMISVGDPVRGQLHPRSGDSDLFRNLFLVHFSLLPHDAGCSSADLFLTYLDNLGRLGLVEVKERYALAGADYQALEKHPVVVEAAAACGIRNPGVRHEAVLLTALGRQFCDACLGETAT